MKKKIIALVIAALIVGGIVIHSRFSSLEIDNSLNLAFDESGELVEASEPINRTVDVKNLIDELQSEREQDPTFKAETKKMEDELEKEIASMRQALRDHRKAMSRLDALTIVQTQYDMEIAQLQAK